MTAVTVDICLLGDFVLRQDGQVISGLDTNKLQALLAYLLLRQDAPQLRYHLAYTFWPDSDEPQARTNLRNLLHRLRQAWPDADQFLIIENKSIGWREAAAYRLDTADFVRAVEQAQAAADPEAALAYWRQAITLYRGDLLPGCYDDWIEPERTRLRQLYWQALTTAVHLAAETQQYETAVQLSRQLIAADPLRETAYQQLLALHARRGDRAAALRVYHRCAAVLRRQLGVEPGPALQEAYQQLLTPEGVGAAHSIPAAASLVGRGFEWEQLLSFWRQTAVDRQPSPFILIGGEAGVGKSRLAEAFVQWVRQEGSITAVAACYAAEKTIPFGPVIGWLHALSLARLNPVWRLELARLLPELTPTDTPLTPPFLTEGWQKQRFYEALTQAVLAQKQPICLLLEDVQWSDPETLAWLHYLLRRDAKSRIFILATYRPEEADNEPLHTLLLTWRQQRRLLEIHLSRLDEADTAALAATILEQALPPAVAAALYRYTEGNPLFIVETIHSSLEMDKAASRAMDPGQRLAQRLSASNQTTAPLPPKILAVIRARLSQLSLTAQRALEAATVIGHSFTVELLLQVSGFPEDELVTAVDELWQRRIVRDREGNAYDFSHDKLRQVAYQAITPARRRWLHGRLAHTLAEMAASHPEPLAGRIAFHYEAAGQIEKAFAYHLQAAAAARLVYAPQEEAFHLQQAIASHTPALTGAGLLARLYEQLGDAYATAGRHDEARQAYQAALAQPPVNETAHAVLTIRLATTWLSQYELDTAWQLFDQVVRLLGDPARYTTERWSIWLDARLAQFDAAYYAANLAQMTAVIAEMQPVIERYGSLSQRILFYHKQAQVHSRQTRFRHAAEGVAYARAALQLAQESGDEAQIHACRFALGFMLLWQDTPDLETAVSELKKAASGSQVMGNIPLLDRCLAYLTTAYRLQGETDRVRALLPRSLSVAESEENDLYTGVARAHQAWLDSQAGCWHGMMPALQAVIRQWQKFVFPFHWLAGWPFLAAAVQADDMAAAVAQAQAILAPEQHQLPADIETALITAVAHPTPSHFQTALTLAHQRRIL